MGLALESRSGSVTPARNSASVNVKAVSSVPFDVKEIAGVGKTGVSLKLRIEIPTD